MTKKKLILILFTISLAILSYLVALKVVEKFFFDKLLYKKSTLHGYHNSVPNLLNYQHSPLIEKRIKDIRDLTQPSSNENNMVLGTSSDDDYQIVIIGDSFVYGTGVKQSNSFPKLVEKELNKYRNTKVFTLAQPGDGILENYTKFILAKENINPDLFIVGLLHNDLLIDSSDKYPQQQNIYKNLIQACPQPEFKYSWSNHHASISELIIDGFYPSSQPEFSNLCYLDKIVNSMVTSPVLFLSFHSDPDSYSPDSNNETDQKSHVIMKQYTQTIENHGGKIVYFDDRLEYKPISKMEDHPSNEIHRAYSELLINEIIGNSQYNFSL
jgi:hypothetical protein